MAGESHIAETNIQVLDPHTQEALNLVFPECRSYSIHPATLIQQDGTQNDLYHNPDIKLPENRWVIVIRAAHPDKNIQEVIFKMRFGDPKNDPRNSEVNEMYFVRDAIPVIQAALSPALRQKIRFTNIVAMHPEMRSFISHPVFEGALAGGIHMINPYSKDLLTEATAICDVLTTIRNIGPELLQNSHFTFSPKDTRVRIFNKYSADLEGRRKILISHFGTDFVARLEQLLNENKTLLTNSEEYFIAGDTNPSNWIRNPDGTLCLFDWERMGKTNNPAYDYGFLFTDLWNVPRIQDQVFNHIISTNPDILEPFRMDFIFNRGTGELVHWLGTRDYATGGQQQWAKQAIFRLTQLLYEAVNYNGIWKTE
jgi:hypothetical protein